MVCVAIDDIGCNLLQLGTICRASVGLHLRCVRLKDWDQIYSSQSKMKTMQRTVSDLYSSDSLCTFCWPASLSC